MNATVAQIAARLQPGMAAQCEMEDRRQAGGIAQVILLRDESLKFADAGELIAVREWRAGLNVEEPVAVGLVMFEALERVWETWWSYHDPGAPAGHGFRQLATQAAARVLCIGDGGRLERDLRFQRGYTRVQRFAATVVRQLAESAPWRPEEFELAMLRIQRRYPSVNERWEALGRAREPGWLPTASWTSG